MQRVGMNQPQLNQDELLRISRAISDTTRYALLEKSILTSKSLWLNYALNLPYPLLPWLII